MPSLAPLNIIALISGGKDSLFSLLHCLQNGHRIVALANLYPAQSSSGDWPSDNDDKADDLNSFMYQTVGHTIVPLYAEALDLPLYRRQIHGNMINTDREYAFAEHGAIDETEDLVSLLEDIKQTHPNANGLSTGAILSTYQRSRVESVAARLQLTSLAYLWQYPTLPPPTERLDSMTGLLDDMEAVGCDARLIKVSSAGIKESLLWSRVSDPVIAKRLAAGMSLFSEASSISLRSAVVGEGGEYETLTVNGPPRLWKKRIDVDDRDIDVVHSEGGVAHLTFGRGSLVDQEQDHPFLDEAPLVRLPRLLDDKFKMLLLALEHTEDEQTHGIEKCGFTASIAAATIRKGISRNKSSFTFNNLTDGGLSLTASDQTTAIMKQLQAELQAAVSSSKRITPCIIFTTILLRNISDFPSVNVIYGKHFDSIHPPARVTICCGETLPRGVLVSMSFAGIQADPSRLTGLHVQSISYWAPANIGPYSQTISVRMSALEDDREEVVHVAGQIPLVPGSMQLLSGNDLESAILSLQHLWRLGQCAGVDWWVYGVAYLADGSMDDVQGRARTAWQVWKEANATPMPQQQAGVEDDEECNEDDIDAWDLKHNHQLNRNQSQSQASAHMTPNSHLHTLPKSEVLARSTHNTAVTSSPSSKSCPNSSNIIPPFFAANVCSLPRSAPIEWHSLGLAHLAKHPTSRPCLQTHRKTNASFSMSVCSWQRRQQHQQQQSPRNHAESKNVETANQGYHLPRGAPHHGPLRPHTDKNPDLASLDADEEAKDERLDFFVIQIYSPTTASSDPTTKEEESTASNTSTTTPISSTHLNGNRTSKRSFQNLTIYTTTPAYTEDGLPQLLLSLLCNDNNNNNNDDDEGHDREEEKKQSDHPNNNLRAREIIAAATVIPCLSIWGEEGKRVQVAVVGQIAE